MKKLLVLPLLALFACGPSFDGTWTGSTSAGGLTFTHTLKMSGNTFTDTLVLAAGSPLLTTVATGTFKTATSGSEEKITLTVTSETAKDGTGADVPVTATTCETKANCQGFSINLGGMVDCQCATNEYVYTLASDKLTIKAFGGADVTFTKGK